MRVLYAACPMEILIGGANTFACAGDGLEVGTKSSTCLLLTEASKNTVEILMQTKMCVQRCRSKSQGRKMWEQQNVLSEKCLKSKLKMLTCGQLLTGDRIELVSRSEKHRCSS